MENPGKRALVSPLLWIGALAHFGGYDSVFTSCETSRLTLRYLKLYLHVAFWYCTRWTNERYLCMITLAFVDGKWHRQFLTTMQRNDWRQISAPTSKGTESTKNSPLGHQMHNNVCPNHWGTRRRLIRPDGTTAVYYLLRHSAT